MRIEGINISKEKGTQKTPIESAEINEFGIVGDAHAGAWHRQISILGKESIERFVEKAGFDIAPGAFAENIILSGINFKEVSILDRIRIGSVLLEVTQIGKECHGAGCIIAQRVGECVMPKEGFFVRVLETGKIKIGETAEYIKRSLDIHIITLSDRASAGIYEDKSGPMIKKMLEEYFSDKRWHLNIQRSVIPDESEELKSLLLKEKKSMTDVVFTTGGTGIGPRDITPDVVVECADKIIPGIMDFIRIKYGAEKPSALISRSVAAIMGETLVFVLPGSVRGVTEYVSEIVKVLEHSIMMVNGLGH